MPRPVPERHQPEQAQAELPPHGRVLRDGRAAGQPKAAGGVAEARVARHIQLHTSAGRGQRGHARDTGGERAQPGQRLRAGRGLGAHARANQEHS